MLRSIAFPEKLSPEDYARYALLTVQATCRSGRTLPPDSLVEAACIYNKVYGSADDKALACFYKGYVYENQGKEDSAENERNYSKKYEKQCNNRRRNEEKMVAERENIQVTEEKELLQQRTQGSRNEMEIVFDAVSCNESFARVAVAAFITHLNPTLEELADIKTAVSEAVTNAIIHGYENLSGYTKHGEMRPAYSIIHPGKVRLHCILENDTLSIEVSDQGKGIEDVARAMEPLFTTKPELERSGMGFAFMEAFMDELEVESIPGKGTRVHMWKKMRCGDWIGKED